MTLKTIEQHDEERRAAYARVASGKTGIACPCCNEELYEVDPRFLFTSSPPQKAVACKCGYKGTVLA